MEIKSLDETDVTNLGISKLFLDSKKTPFFNKQPTNKSMKIFNSDKHVIVEYFSFLFFPSLTALTGTRTGQNVGSSEWPK